MLYSCGKDSALAFYRMISAGHTPVCFIVTYNSAAGRSWFHGVTPDLLDSISKSMHVPIIQCNCTGGSYAAEVERCLRDAKRMGAEAAVFGDIDIEDHLEWNTELCEKTELMCMNPLWLESREELVHEMIDAGFKAVIKCVDVRKLSSRFLGETLNRELAAEIAATGADICGENGEYHTFVYDGPTYRNPIPIKLGEKIDFGSHIVIDITL